MQYYFDENFIKQVGKLLKNNAYRDCEKAIVKNIFNKTFEELKVTCLAKRVTGSIQNPVAKIRINYNVGKRGSYRLYFIALLSKEKIHLGYLYPKTGKYAKPMLEKNTEEPNVIENMVNAIRNKSFKEVYSKDMKIYYSTNNARVW